jgi:uncharacterized membrane protein
MTTVRSQLDETVPDVFSKPISLPRAPVVVLNHIYFVWVELFRLNTICIWCTLVHLSTLALLGTVLWVVTDA